MRPQCAALASASSRFHPGCCCSVCSSWQVTGTTGPESAVLPPLSQEAEPALRRGDWKHGPESTILPFPENLIFSSGGKNSMHPPHLSKIRKPPLALDRALHSWSRSWDSKYGRRYRATHLGMSQTEWRGDPQITRRFLDFLKVGFKNENFIHKQFWRKKTTKTLRIM